MQESLKELNAFPSLLFLFQEVQLIQSRLYKLPIIVHKQLRWPRLVGQLGGLFKVYSDCHSYRQNLLGQIFLSLLLRL